MYSVCDDLKGRVSPFGNLRIKACLSAPRSLSQATTSFIACNRQGIHHVHLFTCPYNVGLCPILPQSGAGQRRHSDSEYCVAFAVSKTASLARDCFRYLMIDTIITHQYRSTALAHCQSVLTILYYFFQIVKERTANDLVKK